MGLFISIAPARRLLKPACLGALLALGGAGPGPAPESATAPLRGVNFAGAEFAPGQLPGRVDVDYVYPTDAQLGWAAAMGFTVIRLPVLWERLQPTLDGPLDGDELRRVRQVVAGAGRRGMATIIDAHNYGIYRGHAIGSAEAPIASFADFWRRLAEAFQTDRTVIFGLMNEPNGTPAQTWPQAAQAALDAIRKTGAGNLVLAPGAGWDGAHDFVSGAGGATPNAVAMAGLVDPAGALAFEVHQYIDADFSGTHTDCPAAGRAAALLQPFTDWMRDGGRHGFLGEFGVPPRPECLAALAEMVRFMDDNRDVWAGWAYWAAGAWWGPAYPYSIEPADGQDRPQAKVLRHPARSAP